MAGAIAGSLVANAAHGLVDFVWYVPGCMAVVAVLAACAFRLAQLARSQSSERIRSRPMAPAVAWAGAAVLAAVGGWMIYGRVGPVFAEPAWHHYLIARMTERTATTADPTRPQRGAMHVRRKRCTPAMPFRRNGTPGTRGSCWPY
jgi:hypothetical protein